MTLSRNRPATDFEKPPAVSFTDFTETFLSDWFGEASAPGDTTASPRDAAAKAVYAAVVMHKGERRGVVMVNCSDAGGARQVMDYLKAIAIDQAHIAPMVKTVLPDGIEFRAGLRILVASGDTRRPRGLLATIRLVPAAEARSSVPATDFDKARLVAHVAMDALHGDGDRAQVSALIKMLLPQKSLEAIAAGEREEAARHAAAWKHKRSTVVGSTELLPAPEPSPSREDYIVSAEFEQRRADRQGLQSAPLQRHAITRRWGA